MPSCFCWRRDTMPTPGRAEESDTNLIGKKREAVIESNRACAAQTCGSALNRARKDRDGANK
jgi:hypothetical protein